MYLSVLGVLTSMGIIMNNATNNSSTNNNYFAALSAINVSEHLEKKGQFSYLSWPYAVAQLRLFDETATWEVIRFNGLPFLTTENGTFVEVAVTVKGITLSQIHPVLDNKNRPIDIPTVFDINTSIQRCLVKAIALHGLGLSVYAGEDLPKIDNEPLLRTVSTAQINRFLPATSGKVTELLTDPQLRYLKKLIAETHINETQLLSFLGFAALEAIPKSEVNRVIRTLESHKQEAA